jgi:hypothetical protein
LLTKNLLGSILKDLPAGFTVEDGEFWGIATVEVPDKEGDIVRVAGMDLGYHTPESPIKILAQHQTRLPDGRLPIVGTIKEFRPTRLMKGGGEVPALLFRGGFSKDGQGNYLPLAKEYKDYADGGSLTDFSIGAEIVESQPIKGGGRDFTRTKLYEVSWVVVGANQHAQKIASADNDELLNTIKYCNEQIEAVKAMLGSAPPQYITDLNKRLDKIEALLKTAGTPDAAEQATDHDPQTKEADITEFAKLVSRLHSLLK